MTRSSPLYFKVLMAILFLLTGIDSIAQKFADKKYYLVDSVVVENLSKEDRDLMESALKCYHASKVDTVRMNCLIELIETCGDDALWPKYNRFVLAMAKA